GDAGRQVEDVFVGRGVLDDEARGHAGRGQDMNRRPQHRDASDAKRAKKLPKTRHCRILRGRSDGRWGGPSPRGRGRPDLGRTCAWPRVRNVEIDYAIPEPRLSTISKWKSVRVMAQGGPRSGSRSSEKPSGRSTVSASLAGSSHPVAQLDRAVPAGLDPR